MTLGIPNYIPPKNRIKAEGPWGGASWDGHLNVGAYIWSRRIRDRSSPFFKVVDYNPLWDIIAKKEIDYLINVFSNSIPFVEIIHVGSTSIPGMTAKPSIQLMVGVDLNFPIYDVCKFLRDLGWVGTDDSGFMYKKPKDDDAVGVAICFVIYESSYWNSRVIFRDYFIDHPEEIKVYSDLKKNNYAKGLSFGEYTRAKQDYIYKILIRQGFSKEDMLQANVMYKIPSDVSIPMPLNIQLFFNIKGGGRHE